MKLIRRILPTNTVVRVVPVVGALVVTTAVGCAEVGSPAQDDARDQALLQAGREWQERYEQTAGPLGVYTKSQLAQMKAGREWEQRYRQMYR